MFNKHASFSLPSIYFPMWSIDKYLNWSHKHLTLLRFHILVHFCLSVTEWPGQGIRPFSEKIEEYNSISIWFGEKNRKIRYINFIISLKQITRAYGAQIIRFSKIGAARKSTNYSCDLMWSNSFVKANINLS